jgi:hypothetical protein
LYVYFVCHIEISQDMMPPTKFDTIGEPLMRGVHWCGFIMFGPIVQELLNIEQNCHWILIKPKLKFIMKLGHTISIVGKL